MYPFKNSLTTLLVISLSHYIYIQNIFRISVNNNY